MRERSVVDITFGGFRTMDNKQLMRSAIAGVTFVALTACGADNIATPGEGQIVVLPAPTPPPPPPPPPPTPTPTPTPTGPAASCPTGTADVGTIVTGNSQTLRNCQLGGTILGSLRLKNLPGTIYSLSGKVQVGQDRGPDTNAPLAGATAGILTIDAGTVLFGASGADFLVVNRGSQLFTDGNATAPVVMTSRNNVIGQSGASSIGEWGGLVILGRAPIADCADQGATGGTVQCQSPVEGTSGSVYGGASATDNSGSIRYLEVRFSGFKVDTDNELNGITLAGIGSGTTFEYVSVHNSSDDGIEWFGGTLNSRYIVMTGNDDDNFDQDSGYVGNSQFSIVTQRADGGDHIVEYDSTDKPVDATPRSDSRLANFTFLGQRSSSILIRGGGDFVGVNGVVVNPNDACLDIDTAATIQPKGAAADENGPPVFNSVVFSCKTPYTDDTDVTAAQVMAIFTSGTNNNPTFTSTLTNGFINGPNENAVVPFNAMTLAPYFMTTNYIGAVRDSNDTWWRGWACGLNITGSPSCTSIPAAPTA